MGETSGSGSGNGSDPDPLGEKSLDAERNPFYVSFRRGVRWVAGGALLALVIYFGLQWWLSYKLTQAIENADGLSRILQSSTLYPQKKGESLAPKSKVNPLAIALWLAELKVASSDLEIEQILEEGQYSVLIAALRFGGHCQGQRGELQELVLPSVRRLVELGAFFANDCATSQGTGISSATKDDLVKKIAAGGRSGGDLFKSILTAHSVFDSVEKPKVSAHPGVEQLQKSLDVARGEANDAQSVVNDARQPDAQKAKAKQKLEAARGREKVIEAEIVKLQESVRQENEDRQGTQGARLVVYGLGALRDKGDKSGLGDAQMRTVQAFATALVSSIEADPDVASWRRYLAAVTGYEQYLILALFLITGGLMIERYLAFKRHRHDVVDMIGKLRKEIGEGPSEPEAAETNQERRQRRRDSQANVALTRADILRSLQKPGGAVQSDIVMDMNKAARSDLSQIHLFGVSDQRIDKMAESLKDKIESSRQLVVWGITTLPALGFLGTVRGILVALSAVGGLSQGDNVARLGALLDVSDALGLAFATTLFALVFMIVLSYVDINQARSEKALVDGLRDFLNDRVLP